MNIDKLRSILILQNNIEVFGWIGGCVILTEARIHLISGHFTVIAFHSMIVTIYIVVIILTISYIYHAVEIFGIQMMYTLSNALF